MKVCPKCGRQSPDDSRFCNTCGSDLQAVAPMYQDPSASSLAEPGLSPPGEPVHGAGLPPPPPPPPADQPTSGKAIASLVCGIACFFPGTSIAAVILGHLALRDIKQSQGRLGGSGMAVAGLVLGYIAIALWILYIALFAFTLPQMLEQFSNVSETVTVQQLRNVNSALNTYALVYPDVGYPEKLSHLGGSGGDPEAAGLLQDALTQGQVGGYFVTYSAGDSDRDGRNDYYEIFAAPGVPGTVGKRHFYTDQTGIIRYSEDGPADSESPEVGNGSTD